MIYITSLTQKGQVTIPVDIRRFLNIYPNEKVTFTKRKKEVVISATRSFISLKGSLITTKKWNNKIVDRKVAAYVAEENAQKKHS